MKKFTVSAENGHEQVTADYFVIDESGSLVFMEEEKGATTAYSNRYWNVVELDE